MAKDTKKNIFEHTHTVVDEDGIIQEQTSEIVKPSEKEPDYIKLYLDCVCTFKGLSTALSPVLIGFCHFMTWADSEHQKQMVFTNSYVKEQVAQMTGLKIDRVNKALKAIVDAGIFIRVPKKRGVYEVNPFIIAKGSWSDIKKLRANFDFVNGTITPEVITEETQDNKSAISKFPEKSKKSRSA